MSFLEKVTSGTADSMKLTKGDELALIALAEQLLPTLRKFLDPVKEKLEEFIAGKDSQDENIIIVRRIKGKTLVFIAKANSPELLITKDSLKLGEKDTFKVFDVDQFISQIADDNAFRNLVADWKEKTENKEE